MYLWKRIWEHKIVVISGLFFLLLVAAGVFAPVLASNDPLSADITLRYAGSTLQYPLGNDYLGRCILSRLLYAIRPSFLLVFLVLLITVLIGAAIGMLAGYFGGKIDSVMMRICDVFLTLPSEVLVLAFVGLLGVGLKNILLAYVLLQWASYARLTRTCVSQYKNANYVLYSKAAGNSSFYIILHHILPAALSEIIVFGMGSVSTMILLVSSMSYLGLGIQPPAPEWGTMLLEAKTVMFQHPEQMLIPGLAIVLISLDCAFLSDGLRDVFDPQYAKEEKGI